ncbi:30S ribosomal protein S1 [compost metagenome]
MHISALSEKFIKDPREAVKAGDVVKVKVMEIDIPRKRVGLSMRMSDTPGEKIDGARGSRPGSAPRQQGAPARAKETPAPANNAMASLFANAKQLKKK